VTAWAKLVIGLVVATVVGVIGATVLVASKVREETVVEHPYEEGLKHTERRPAPCDVGAGPCTAPLEGGGEVTLEIGPRPIRTMTELTVRANLRRLPAGGEVAVAFSMAGMEMGPNRIVLTPAADGTLSGKAVLVRCASGRRDWVATVTVAVRGEAPRTARFSLTAVE
jgi:hypothetical protein